MSVEKDVFRRVMGRFPTGVTVITTRHGEHLHGMTANAVTALSLEPMLMLICVDKTADTHDILEQAGVFTVNILREDQRAISDRLAKKAQDGAPKLEGIPHRRSPTGCAIIEGSVGYLDCKTVLRYEGGDHTIFIGEVVDAGEEDGEPLVFHQGRYAKLRPESS